MSDSDRGLTLPRNHNRRRCRMTDRQVELHRFLPRDMMAESPRAAMLEEIHQLKSLAHPNVLKVLACFGDADDLHCVTEDVSKNARLADMVRHCRKNKRLLPERSLWKFFVQLCRGVEYLHRMGRVHGQLTTRHALVSDAGVVRVALSCHWFGEREQPCRYDPSKGPWHVPPERIVNGGLTQKGDVWALGCILYELAALRHPFIQPDSGNVYKFVTAVRALRYATLPPDVYSSPLRALVTACLKADPAVRPSSITVLRIAELQFIRTSEHWTVSGHRRAPPAAREAVLTMMLVARRLARRASAVLPGLPTEMWLEVLQQLRVGELDAWGQRSRWVSRRS